MTQDSTQANINLDFEAFFAAIDDRLATLGPPGDTVAVDELRPDIEVEFTRIFAANQPAAGDAAAARNTMLTSMLLAIYRVGSRRIPNQAALVAAIGEALVDVFTRQLASYIEGRFDVRGDRPDEAFTKITKNFMGRGVGTFGTGFTYEEDVVDDQHGFFNVTKCFFLEFFQTNGAPELTSVICRLDAIWADEMNAGAYNVTFERPTLMSDGADKCRFQFTRTGERQDDEP